MRAVYFHVPADDKSCDGYLDVIIDAKDIDAIQSDKIVSRFAPIKNMMIKVAIHRTDPRKHSKEGDVGDESNLLQRAIG